MFKAKLTESLHATLAALPRKTFDERSIKAVTMVGARREGPHLGPIDAQYLAEIFKICADNNIRISREPEINVMNIEEGGRQDFLRDPIPSHMVIFSYIMYEPSLIGLYRIPDCARQSTLAGEEGAWHRALLKSGANIAFNVYQGDGANEVPTNFFDRAPFIRVSTTTARIQIKPDETQNRTFACLIR